MAKRACADCEFWETENRAEANEDTIGDCKFNPPTVFAIGKIIKIHSPQTLASDWCAQHKERKQQRKSYAPRAAPPRSQSFGP